MEQITMKSNTCIENIFNISANLLLYGDSHQLCTVNALTLKNAV